MCGELWFAILPSSKTSLCFLNVQVHSEAGLPTVLVSFYCIYGDLGGVYELVFLVLLAGYRLQEKCMLLVLPMGLC